MKVLRSENIKPFDVDSTLVLPADGSEPADSKYVLVEDGVTGNTIKVAVHAPMVRLLLEEKHRGAFIIVWSRSGYEWAEAVVKALDLTMSVDLVLSKPLVYFDDQDVSTWMKDRVYLTPETIYKRAL